MSKPIEALLAECEDLIARNQVGRAHDNLLEWIRHGSKQDIERLQATLEEIIGRFLPKRKRDLRDALQARLAAREPRQEQPRDSPPQLVSRLRKNETKQLTDKRQLLAAA